VVLLVATAAGLVGGVGLIVVARRSRPWGRSGTSRPIESITWGSDADRRLGRPGRIGEVAAGAYDDVVTAERGGQLVRRGGAAGL
jgi:hypothetical protein